MHVSSAPFRVGTCHACSIETVILLLNVVSVSIQVKKKTKEAYMYSTGGESVIVS